MKKFRKWPIVIDNFISLRRFPVPRHGAKEVADGTLADIVSQSGIKI